MHVLAELAKHRGAHVLNDEGRQPKLIRSDKSAAQRALHQRGALVASECRLGRSCAEIKSIPGFQYGRPSSEINTANEKKSIASRLRRPFSFQNRLPVLRDITGSRPQDRIPGVRTRAASISSTEWKWNRSRKENQSVERKYTQYSGLRNHPICLNPNQVSQENNRCPNIPPVPQKNYYQNSGSFEDRKFKNQNDRDGRGAQGSARDRFVDSLRCGATDLKHSIKGPVSLVGRIQGGWKGRSILWLLPMIALLFDFIAMKSLRSTCMSALHI